MMGTCLIPNCRKSAPATEPFCVEHRDDVSWERKYQAAVNNWAGEVADLQSKLHSAENAIVLCKDQVAHLEKLLSSTEIRLGSCETALHRIIEAWDGDSESMHDDPAEIAREALGLAVEDQRPCTCHPDDNPPVPCARKYALEECRAAAVQEHGPSDQPLLKRIYNDLLMRAEVVNGTPVVALGSSVWRDLCHALEGGMVTGSGPEAEAVVRQLAKDAAAVEKLKPPECPYCFPKDGKHAASCELASASEGQSTPIHKCAFCGESQIKSNHVCSGTTTALDRRGTE